MRGRRNDESDASSGLSGPRTERSVAQDARVKRSQGFWWQIDALTRKAAVYERRRWPVSVVILLIPVIVCVVLWGLQLAIDTMITSNPNTKCGCRCLECCQFVENPDTGRKEEVCFESGAEVFGQQVFCSPYAECKREDPTECGFTYSNIAQVAFCDVYHPALWPAVMSFPADQYRDQKLSPPFPQEPPGLPRDWALMTWSADPAAERVAARVMPQLLKPVRPLQTRFFELAPLLPEFRTLQTELVANRNNISVLNEGALLMNASLLFAQAMSQSEAVLGSDAGIGVTLMVDSAFYSEAGAIGELDMDDLTVDLSAPPPEPRPLYYVSANCSELSRGDRAVLDLLSREASRGLSAVSEGEGGPTMECASAGLVRRGSVQELTGELYCGWRTSSCVFTDPEFVKYAGSPERADDAIRKYPSAIYEWRSAELSPERTDIDVVVHVNSSVIAQPFGAQGAPATQRWNTPVSLLVNAVLRSSAVENAEKRIRMIGFRDMPVQPAKLELALSVLLGPLLFMWAMQMIVPVMLFTICSEKEQDLRAMMRLHGLRDWPYYVVLYGWHLLLYTGFMALFWAVGWSVGLSIFVYTKWSLQLAIYFVWGNLSCAWSMAMGAMASHARFVVLTFLVWLLLSGFLAGWVQSFLIESGPLWASRMMQIHPSFGLFRLVYEMAAYSFVAVRNGDEGVGEEWSNLSDEGNDTSLVLVIMAVQWGVFLTFAWYIEQVTSSGTGVAKHWLFPLGLRRGEKKQAARRDGGRKAGSSGQKNDRSDLGGVAADVNDFPWVIGGRRRTTKLEALQMQALDIEDGEAAAADAAATGSQAPQNGAATADGAGAVPPIERLLSLGTLGAEPVDVACERASTAALAAAVDRGSLDAPAILIQGLRKDYRSRGHTHTAVHDLTLAIPTASCFGLLGPNGAGKTTTIKMMEGFIEATNGRVLVEGLDVANDMDKIFPLLGVCPQHDIVWPSLTPREHLYFYGRLKGLRGHELTRAVEDGLTSVDLLQQGLAEKRARQLSGGQRRRLSVAIALIGDPKVVFMDEPSTGLDPASRRLLWNCVRRARERCAVVLSTHSMEEAEALCDRIGIILGGRLACVGTAQELTNRYSSQLLLSVQVEGGEDDVDAVIQAATAGLASGALHVVYRLGGSVRMEMDRRNVPLSEVLTFVGKLAQESAITDWAVSHATLESVFLHITQQGGASADA
ncbi:unnamed protein product [Pedinophyceae sp. YPF-701]|nr:unnamed protein product [Pedinophyceae sp. YPF-701]